MEKDKNKYLEEYAKIAKDYFDFEDKYHNYLSQFFSVWINGKEQKRAIMGDSQAEYEKRKKIRLELEEKKKKVMEAQEKYLLICKNRDKR